MMVGACIALAFILLLRFGPDVPFLRVIRVATVEMPARWLPQLERHQIFAFIFIAVIIAAGGKLFVAFAPDLVALIATNLGIYFDATAISVLLALATTMQRAARVIRAEPEQRCFFARRNIRRAARAIRTRPLATKSSAANEDEPGLPAWAA